MSTLTNTETVFAELSWELNLTRTHDCDVAEVMSELSAEYFPGLRFL